MEKLDKFLEENNLKLETRIIVSNQDIFNCIKPDVIKLVLSCIKSDYEIKEIKINE